MVLGQLFRSTELPLTIGGSALLWVSFVALNNHMLFNWMSVTNFRHLVFVPAGLKLVMVMALGARASLGIALGTMTYVHSDIPALSPAQALALAMTYAGAPLLVLAVFSRVTGIAKPWLGLSAWHLALIAVAVAVVSSLAFNGLLAGWDVIAGTEVLGASVAMAGGDVAGSFLLFSAALYARSVLRRARP